MELVYFSAVPLAIARIQIKSITRGGNGESLILDKDSDFQLFMENRVASQLRIGDIVEILGIPFDDLARYKEIFLLGKIKNSHVLILYCRDHVWEVYYRNLVQSKSLLPRLIRAPS